MNRRNLLESLAALPVFSWVFPAKAGTAPQIDFENLRNVIEVTSLPAYGNCQARVEAAFHGVAYSTISSTLSGDALEIAKQEAAETAVQELIRMVKETLEGKRNEPQKPA